MPKMFNYLCDAVDLDLAFYKCCVCFFFLHLIQKSLGFVKYEES